MNRLARAGLVAALALTCIDGQAKVAEHCITMLEARPAGVDTPPPAPRKPCPIAVGYTRPSSVTRPAAVAPITREAVSSSRLDAASDDVDGAAPVRRALHV